MPHARRAYPIRFSATLAHGSSGCGTRVVRGARICAEIRQRWRGDAEEYRRWRNSDRAKHGRRTNLSVPARAAGHAT